MTPPLASERLTPGHVWYRVADPGWIDPLDPSPAGGVGGRWNPPGSFPALYLNADIVTARLNVRLFVAGWPYEPEDLRDDTAPILVGAELPRDQDVADIHTPAGVSAAGLPATYPVDRSGNVVPHTRCQPIGRAARADGLRGLRCRSARTLDGAGRELAWFPATSRSRPSEVSREPFSRWFWA